MVNKLQKNSDCHLFSKAQKVIYGKIKRALGRNVEKNRNEGEGWMSGHCVPVSFCARHIWPHLHPDKQEMT